MLWENPSARLLSQHFSAEVNSLCRLPDWNSSAVFCIYLAMTSQNIDEYARGTHAHRRSAFRFSHQRRFVHALRLLEARPDCRILDYGAGDAFLLELLSTDIPHANLVALEPIEYLRTQIEARFAERPIQILTSTQQLPDCCVERIACLEVLEHLQDNHVLSTLAELRRLLTADGIIVISVPIEIGAPALIKYGLSRLLTGSDRRHTWREVLRATFGLPVPRNEVDAFIPHKGFDYRKLRVTLSQEFVIEREVFSPLPWLRGLLNAQVLWRLTPRRRSLPSAENASYGIR